MTRRTRTAALLSTATLLAGAGFSLALAPSAAADPPLANLHVDDTTPEPGQKVYASGEGCYAVQLSKAASSGDTTAAPAQSGATDGAIAATPAATAAPAADGGGSVSVTITGPDSFESGDTASASGNGTWTADNGIEVGDAGTYTVQAKCTLTDPVLGVSASFQYDPITLTVSAPAPTTGPSIACGGCNGANPGDTVSIGGNGYPSGAVVTVSLAGYGDKSATADASGAFPSVPFVLASTQVAATLRGQVTSPGVAAQTFTVVVTTPSDPGGGNADGPVTGNDTGTDSTGVGVSSDATDPGAGDFDGTSGTNVVSSAPSLPSTGTDSLWPGVVGGLLVAGGGALLWAGRRREDADVTA